MSHSILPPFQPLPPDLPEAEAAARQKRQSHAEWGLAVAALGGTLPSSDVLAELQRYIDGQLSLADLAQLPLTTPCDRAAALAVVRRHQLADYGTLPPGAECAA
jgi:hypothetical protein